MGSQVASVAEVFVDHRRSEPPKPITSFTLFPNQNFRIGRDVKTPGINDLILAELDISRSHLEFYSVAFDNEGKHCPLVYVRDLGSLNGTYVNGRLIGEPSRVSRAILLQDGDIIQAAQTFQLRFRQAFVPQVSFTLTPHQRQELARIKDRYVVTDRCIGDGACSSVFLAFDVKTGKQVACKVHNLKSSHLASRRKIRRIKQEAILLSHLDHPNIISFLNAFQTSESIYMFTELATGGDLFSLILRKVQLCELEIRLVVSQVLHALTYLHAKGVSHRDIKPENILCATYPSPEGRFVLSDFGDAAVGRTGAMMSGMGTECYRAPECLHPDTIYNVSVDIWALGVVTLELFADVGAVRNGAVFQPKSQIDVDMYLSRLFAKLCAKGAISYNGVDFIRRCLVFDADHRLTAEQALKHDWFHETEEAAAKIKRVQQDALASWLPRTTIVSQPIENLSLENTPPLSLASSPAATVNTDPATVALSDTLSKIYGEPTVSPYFQRQRRQDPGTSPTIILQDQDVRKNDNVQPPRLLQDTTVVSPVSPGGGGRGGGGQASPDTPTPQQANGRSKNAGKRSADEFATVAVRPTKRQQLS